MGGRKGDSYLGGHTIWPPKKPSTISLVGKSFTEKYDAQLKRESKAREDIKRKFRHIKTPDRLFLAINQEVATKSGIKQLSQLSVSQIQKLMNDKAKVFLGKKLDYLRIADNWNAENFLDAFLDRWTPKVVEYLAERLEGTSSVKLIKAIDAQKLLNKTVKSKTYFGVNGATKINFSELKIEECKALLGTGNRGFGIFSISTNSRLQGLKSANLTEIADAFNASGWKTFNGAEWNWTLVGVFIQIFGKQKKLARASLKQAKRKKRSTIIK